MTYCSRSIGVSNFNSLQLKDIMEVATVSLKGRYTLDIFARDIVILRYCDKRIERH